jgi:subtilisin family serine protease
MDVPSVLDVVNLTRLMDTTLGAPDLLVGLIDGPVAVDHSDLAGARLRALGAPAACSRRQSDACAHGTFVAGMLTARRGSAAPAICPGCTLLVRPVFAEPALGGHDALASRPDELAAAMADCIAAGARVLNLSLALEASATRGHRAVEDVLDLAASRGVVVVAAAGNQRATGTSCLTRHGWVIPVAGCDRQGRPLGDTNFSRSLGRQGLLAPGDGITSLDAKGGTATLRGTSAATAFVTGTIALLWSIMPEATASQMKLAVSQAGVSRRCSVAPPVLDGWGAGQTLARHRTQARSVSAALQN